MKNITAYILAVIFTVSFTACNKTRQYSKRMAGETWQVTELSVDGTNEAELPVLVFEDCDIYEESCRGEWKNEEGGHGEFVWQFRKKGKVFEISNQSDHSHGHADEEAQVQLSNFSGVYDVTGHKKEEMRFESSSTAGFPGHKVVIKMERK